MLGCFFQTDLLRLGRSHTFLLTQGIQGVPGLAEGALLPVDNIIVASCRIALAAKMLMNLY